MSARYFKSEKFLDVAESRIPLGSQTFSKSKTQYPVGVSPLFAKYAKGAYIWDIDKNKYLDLVSALAAVTLGYQNRRIDSAVKRQLKKGVTLSLPTKLEYEVAELIGLMVPSAEMVRFAKNGSDATAGAVRLARAYTNKKIVAMCGYHGWQDWSIVTTSRNAGVPTEVGELTKTFKYNDIDSLMKLFNEFPNQIACVIMEPMNSEFPQGNFLQKIRELCDREEALLIFDETITGFRYNKWVPTVGCCRQTRNHARHGVYIFLWNFRWRTTFTYCSSRGVTNAPIRPGSSKIDQYRRKNQ
jgi:glutamate-1-semialdehyde 2,1-aminomutase